MKQMTYKFNKERIYIYLLHMRRCVRIGFIGDLVVDKDGIWTIYSRSGFEIHRPGHLDLKVLQGKTKISKGVAIILINPDDIRIFVNRNFISSGPNNGFIKKIELLLLIEKFHKMGEADSFNKINAEYSSKLYSNSTLNAGSKRIRRVKAKSAKKKIDGKQGYQKKKYVSHNLNAVKKSPNREAVVEMKLFDPRKGGKKTG